MKPGIVLETNDKQFVQTLDGLKLDPGYLPVLIKTSLTDLLGEVPATVVLSYTGDTSDGNIEGFVRRMQELLGTSASITLGTIAASAAKRARES